MPRLEELDRGFAELLQRAPELRREFHAKAAQIIKQEVDAQLDASEIGVVNEYDSPAVAARKAGAKDRVKRWQVAHVGSGGGYAAVRPIGSADGASTGRDSPGAITNYLEGGHKIRWPKGGKGYRPRLRMSYVNGLHFYSQTQAGLENKLIRAAEEWAGEARRILGG